ncbi:hypothetical protein [Kribbella italica]|uniref:Uncharacterized protein n=1 Tax=Kribbella italica TaxID=1540520 RepID=A0A7W9MW16_9ACTN|nr:hypothetical protein [Kribbella italica]MBB5838531.1 hypothetical protein [Kribbella italica]
MPELPDEVLPDKLAAAEKRLGVVQHRWFAVATLLATLPAGVALLLPWAFSRRLGQSVWQLGIETQPTLALAWLAGLLAAVLALALRPGQLAQAATAVSGVVALIYAAGGWQANTASALSDTWPGPGPAVALVTGLIWVLCASAQLIADHPHPVEPDAEALATAVRRLRQNR